MKRRYWSLALVAIVLLSVTAPAVGKSPDAEFNADVVETTAGETAEIPVTISNTDTATVTIGSESVNYIATVVIQDGDGDQNVTLQYDTSKAGQGGAFSVTDDADTVSVKNETEFDDDHILAVGSYNLAVAPGNDANDETDVGTLLVVERPETTTERGTKTANSQYAGHVDDIEDGVTVAPARNQTITGTLDLTEGTEIVVEVRKGGAFLKMEPTTVEEDGRFRASFDFDDVSSDSEFVVEIRANGTRVEEVTGVFETPPTTPTTTEQALQDETKDSTRDETTSSTQDGTTKSTQDGSIPGFGLLTGVLAFVATVLLVLRRD